MPIINYGKRLYRKYAVSRHFARIDRAARAGILVTILVPIVCGCAANVPPAALDDHRSLADKTGAGLTLPSRGPADAAVTFTVFEEYQ